MQVDIETSIQPLERALRAADPRGLELSLVDLVLLACDVSEDESEIGDLVDGLIRSGAARVLPATCEPCPGP